MGYKDVEPDDISDAASSSLPRVPLEALTPHDAQDDVTPVTESSMTPALRSIPRTKPPNFYVGSRINANIFFRLWNTGRSRIDFALDAPGWDPNAIDALSATLTEYAFVFFPSSKLDYGACSLYPLEIKVPPGTQPIQSRPYRLNLTFSKQADTILDSHLATGLIQLFTCSW